MPEDTRATEAIELTLRSSDDSTKVMRQIVLGMVPLILIEPTLNEEEDELVIKIAATDIESVEELADLFEELAEQLRTGKVSG